jgi:CHAT domain-containing protein
VAALARLRPEALVLRNGSASVELALRALDGATLAHIAAHGRYRPDSPMFSCLILDDGPLTVHDFERLDKAPFRMVLSACESGVMAPVGANEQLGLASVLFSLGTAGIVASVTEVNDQTTSQLMHALHAELASEQSIAEVLLKARTAARGDLMQEATTAAFVALGV